MANATDIEAIFEIITQVCSFLDYNLLERLIDILGNEEDKKRMQKYYEKFDQYVRPVSYTHLTLPTIYSV